MKEIITISFGSHSNEIILQYLYKLIKDHDLNHQDDIQYQQSCSKQLGIPTSFDKLRKEHIFRNISLGDDKSISKMLLDENRNFLNPDFLIEIDSYHSCTYHGAQRIFTSTLQNRFGEQLSSTFEKCDSLNCINIVHSTFDKSSGFLSKILQNQEFPQIFHQTNSIFPNINTCSSIEIYNTVFSLNDLTENVNASFVFDYDAIAKQMKQLNKCDNLSNIQNVIAETILQSNCQMRFPGYLIGDYRKLAVNLISFPRMHFYNSCFSQINKQISLENQLLTLAQPQNSYFTFCKEARNFYRSQAIISRTENNHMLIEQATSKCQNCTYWIENAFLLMNCKIPHFELGDTIMHIGVHNYFGWFCKELASKFMQQFRRKSYLHYYQQEGADEQEFIEVESNICDLYCEYYTYDQIDIDIEE